MGNRIQIIRPMGMPVNRPYIDRGREIRESEWQRIEEVIQAMKAKYLEGGVQMTDLLADTMEALNQERDREMELEAVYDPFQEKVKEDIDRRRSEDTVAFDRMVQ